MHEPLSNVLLWNAFWLGCRATVEAYSIPTNEANRERYLDLLPQIATGDLTLSDPTELAGIFSNSGTAKLAFELEHDLIEKDRELAKRICDGMNTDLR